MVDLSRVIVGFIVINQFVVWFLRADYLASVLDLSSKQVVGWALSKQPNTQLARDALSNAISRHQPNANTLIFHSDQGVQYCANAFVQYCKSKN
ncbi:hypothetical protein [uncultured Gammaproteobacteria bacterium]|nr:hypothetical protein [uncultured Gammaproteobacteria bacterium]CAC9648387.1 hypothetical protein [uncultured Gammaproteobacteria bacterium]